MIQKLKNWLFPPEPLQITYVGKSVYVDRAKKESIVSGTYTIQGQTSFIGRTFNEDIGLEGSNIIQAIVAEQENHFE